MFCCYSSPCLGRLCVGCSISKFFLPLILRPNYAFVFAPTARFRATLYVRPSRSRVLLLIFYYFLCRYPASALLHGSQASRVLLVLIRSAAVRIFPLVTASVERRTEASRERYLRPIRACSRRGGSFSAWPSRKVSLNPDSSIRT